MKRFLLLFAPLLLFAFTIIDLKPVDADDSVIFVIKNLGINTKGSFKGLKGSIKWDAANLSNSSFNVSVDANTINTGIDLRDNDLRKATYFNVAQYPTINFVSTAITATNVAGNLTIKGITKQISFPFTVSKSAQGYVFEGGFTINRRDFDIGSSSFSLGNSVNVSIKVKAVP